jgi:hypothetical protein
LSYETVRKKTFMYTNILELREQYTIQHTWAVQYRLQCTHLSLLNLFINKTNSGPNIHNDGRPSIHICIEYSEVYNKNHN